MDGDGNCLFRSLADQLTGNQNNHHAVRLHILLRFLFSSQSLLIRSKIMDYIAENKEYFQYFIEDDEGINDYLMRMRYVL
jgi:hypothetical protein